MAWEWAPATATAAVGIVSNFFLWLGAHQARQQAAQLAKEQADRAEAVAALARVQDRRAETYVQVLQVAEQVGEWVQSLSPPIELAPPPSPPVPEVAAQVASRARLLAFGSLEVRDLWDNWRTAVAAAQAADRRVRAARSDPMPSPEVAVLGIDARAELWELLQPAEVEARSRLAEQVHLELDPQQPLLPGQETAAVNGRPTAISPTANVPGVT